MSIVPSSCNEVSDVEPDVPSDVLAAFLGAASVTPPRKRAKSSPTAKSATPDKSIQDPLLADVYAKLPKVNKGTFLIWSSSTGPGNFLLSQRPDHCPVLNVQSLWAYINFVQKDKYVNLSRINPKVLQAISQVYRDSKRRGLSVYGKTAVCVPVMMAVKSALQEPSTVVPATPKSTPAMVIIR
ncbi:hypothetical protein K438DRAFT_1763155 [Mycena galopus ATCC 62051]|nr:hypothetical protein K438DRAFT_1763155 [Mycena galopus ATCC 62051]